MEADMAWSRGGRARRQLKKARREYAAAFPALRAQAEDPTFQRRAALEKGLRAVQAVHVRRVTQRTDWTWSEDPTQKSSPYLVEDVWVNLWVFPDRRIAGTLPEPGTSPPSGSGLAIVKGLTVKVNEEALMVELAKYLDQRLPHDPMA
jgi:hypothetical protein